MAAVVVWPSTVHANLSGSSKIFTHPVLAQFGENITPSFAAGAGKGWQRDSRSARDPQFADSIVSCRVAMRLYANRA
jgi:hypothetical protein